MKNIVGKKIRKSRESKKLTREKLAKKLKISPGYLQGLEAGFPNFYLSERVVKKIKTELGKRLDPKDVKNYNRRVLKWRREYRAERRQAA